MYITNLDCRNMWIRPVYMRDPMRLTRPRRRIRQSRRLLQLRKTRLTFTVMMTMTTMTKTRMTSTPTQRMMVRLKTTTPCTLGQRGSRDVRNVRRSHYSPRIATITTMTINLNQAMTGVRRRRNQEGPPRAPYRPPRKLTGQATDCPPRKRRRQFWLRLVRPATLPSSWWPMAWMKSMRSRN